jgi:hypothetical protein
MPPLRVQEWSQSRIHSLKEAVEHKGFDFWYLDVQIDMNPGIELSEFAFLKPSVLRWLPISYGSGVSKTFKFKHTSMKRRERFDIQILNPRVPAELLAPVLSQLANPCSCSSEHLAPVPTEVWEWRQPFGCVLCGARFFCDCFRTAIDKSDESEPLPDVGKADFDGPPEQPCCYRTGICHLCTGTPSNLLYCSPMYGSPVKVSYGAYIKKFAIAEDISERDAENEVRDILGLPHRGGVDKRNPAFQSCETDIC